MSDAIRALLEADVAKANALRRQGYDLGRIHVDDFDMVLRTGKMPVRNERGVIPDLSLEIPAPRLFADQEDGGGLFLRPLSGYESREVEWLKKPFFQGSAFHLLVGKKGVCKGTFLCGLAARVTTGRMYPEGRSVLVVTSEDSVGLDFKPRFVAAEGDESRAFIVNGDFRMPRDIPRLKRVAEQLRDVGLIVVDPIGNHLEDSDTDKEGTVRNAIAPLNGLADELGCMIFGVRHLAKDANRGALASVLGSTAWVDVPRCVIAMAQDDQDEMLFHTHVVAGNRGPKNVGRKFRLHIVDVEGARDVTYLDGLGDSEKDINDLLAFKARRMVAAEKLQALLLEELISGPKSRGYLDDVCFNRLGANGGAVWTAGLAPLRAAGRVRAEKDQFGDWSWMLRDSLADYGRAA